MTALFFVLANAASPFTIADDGEGQWALSEGGRPVLVYRYGDQLPEGVPEDRRRHGYVHPLYGLDGEVLTDDFPRDHYHHRGLYFGWPGVRVGEREVDLWHLNGIVRRFEAWLEPELTADQARFGTRCGWFVGESRVMDEQTRYTVHAADDQGRLIDIDEVLTAAVSITLHPKDAKGYGGFLLRFAPRTETRITTAAGVTPQDTDLVPSPWADESAQFAGAPGRSGIAVMCHADNPGFPNGWCLRHYGFVGVSWPGDGEFTFTVGEPVRLRYRVYIHRGDADEANVAERYAEYAK